MVSTPVMTAVMTTVMTAAISVSTSVSVALVVNRHMMASQTDVVMDGDVVTFAMVSAAMMSYATHSNCADGEDSEKSDDHQYNRSIA